METLIPTVNEVQAKYYRAEHIRYNKCTNNTGLSQKASVLQGPSWFQDQEDESFNEKKE